MVKARSDEIRSGANQVCKSTGWQCPVDQSSINAMCQLHEVYVYEKRRCTDDGDSPSKSLETRIPKRRGKKR